MIILQKVILYTPDIQNVLNMQNMQNVQSMQNMQNVLNMQKAVGLFSEMLSLLTPRIQLLKKIMERNG